MARHTTYRRVTTSIAAVLAAASVVVGTATGVHAASQSDVHAASQPDAHVATKWRTLPEGAGTYRVHAACPPGTNPRSGSVTVRDVKYQGADVPQRWKGGSQGVNGNTWYAKLHLRQGPPVQVKLHVSCL